MTDEDVLYFQSGVKPTRNIRHPQRSQSREGKRVNSCRVDIEVSWNTMSET